MVVVTPMRSWAEVGKEAKRTYLEHGWKAVILLNGWILYAYVEKICWQWEHFRNNNFETARL